jgi:hypothetical protein
LMLLEEERMEISYEFYAYLIQLSFLGASYHTHVGNIS